MSQFPLDSQQPTGGSSMANQGNDGRSYPVDPKQPNPLAKPIKCPNCRYIWCEQEIIDQECFTCGYPNQYDRENDDDTED